MKYCVLFLLLIVAACQSFRDQPVSESQGELALSFDTTHLAIDSLKSRQSVREFYSRRRNEYRWISPSGLFNAEADSLVRFIKDVDQLGLIPRDYHASSLARLNDSTRISADILKMEVLLTDAYLTLFHHLHYGRIDPVTMNIADRTSILDTNAIISLERASPGTLRHELWGRQPDIREYTELRNALQDLCKDTCDEVRARMIHLNMERWRWKRNEHDRYVWVNIPSFLLRVVEDDSLWLETRVIVGKPETPTPVMESIITSFIIYPYWHAPRSIATREILPQLQADASYLRRNNFDVLDRKGSVVFSDTIQWNRYNSGYFPFILRQREGSENSMGIIKFVFANRYGVYLHDTNSKRLFSQAKRALSHGCIRVNNAVALAHYLVREDDIYVSPEDLDQYLSLQQRLTIQLRKPIPVLLDYFTVEVLDGRAVFYDDLYKKDSVLMQRLYPTDGPDLLVSPPI